MKKLKLDELVVKSFTTKLEDEKQRRLRGGVGFDELGIDTSCGEPNCCTQ
jgi:hypothetical protein